MDIPFLTKGQREDLREQVWDERFALLEAFVRREGHAFVPISHREAGYHLGKWVSQQRQNFPKLSERRRQKLASLPGWNERLRQRTGEQPTRQWEANFARLEAYVKAEGHARVPQTVTTPDGFGLGRWVSTQRERRKTLSPEQRRRLEALPGWTWTAQLGWEQRFQALKRLAASQGHTRVPAAVDKSLAAWIVAQRSLRREGRLKLDRELRLAALPGWTWHGNEGRIRSWDEAFARLEAYADTNGHVYVPKGSASPELRRLESWVGEQRRKYRRDALSRYQRERLESLPGWSWRSGREWAWETRVAALEAHAARHGSVDAEGMLAPLRSWAAAQARNGEMLTARQRQRLEALPGWTWIRDEVKVQPAPPPQAGSR